MKPIYFISGILLTVTVATAAPPDFREVYGLVRSNLAGVDQAQLDQAAIKGLIGQFPGRVEIGESAEPEARLTPLVKGKIFDQAFAYLRIGGVSADLPGELRQTWRELTETNKSKIKGVIVDLRFANGTDYAAAGAAADCFLSTAQPLLEWPGGSVAATNKEDAISPPVTVLVNSKTTGAAEALAAVLRASDRGLTVGAKTAGLASVFKEFSLSTGQKIRVATAEVKLAGGPALAGGVTPDIPVQTTLEDDRAYLSDPYKSPHPTEMSGDSQTNTQEARFNEAELVKEHREGLEAGEGLLGTSAEPGAPVIADPSLSRALDVLKGLAVVNGSKPG